jgi:uncharacterized protein
MGLIYLDTCLLIYAVEDDAVHGGRAKDVLSQYPAQQFAISPLVKMECLIHPMRNGNSVLQSYYELLIAQFTLLPIDEAVFAVATKLRAQCGLRTPDALHLACAQVHACDALWTNDNRLQIVGGDLVCNVFA